MAKEKGLGVTGSESAQNVGDPAPTVAAPKQGNGKKERKQHVYGDTEKVMGSPVAEFTVDGELRIPGRQFGSEMAFSVVCGILRVLFRNNRPAYNHCIMAIAGLDEELKRHEAKTGA